MGIFKIDIKNKKKQRKSLAIRSLSGWTCRRDVKAGVSSVVVDRPVVASADKDVFVGRWVSAGGIRRIWRRVWQGVGKF